MGHLARRMKKLRVLDPARQPDREPEFFGAEVTIADEDDNHRTITLVGDDRGRPVTCGASFPDAGSALGATEPVMVLCERSGAIRPVNSGLGRSPRQISFLTR